MTFGLKLTMGFLNGGELTELQRDQLAQKILKLKKAIKTCSSGSRGVLRLDTTLAGGDELQGTHAPQEVEMYSQMYYEDHVKVDADAAIAAEVVTSCGDKLLMNLKRSKQKLGDNTKKPWTSGDKPNWEDTLTIFFGTFPTRRGASSSPVLLADETLSLEKWWSWTFILEILKKELTSLHTTLGSPKFKLSYDDNMEALERDNGHDHCSGVDKAKGGNVESGEDESEDDTYNVPKECDLSSEDCGLENDTYNVSKECDPGPIPSLATSSKLALQDFDSFWTTAPMLVPDVLHNTDYNITLQGVSTFQGVPDILGNTDHDIALQGVSTSDLAEIDRLLVVMPQVDLNFFDNFQVSSFSSGPEYSNFVFSESQSTAGQ
ncbi:hypothetical protein F4604DRAFT_1676834 [Suillus subluteus]|nr:hypothetical protein F4604DRAFT_1676834 [Suillus subluteus]